jgi:hypothetical protein
MIHDGESSFKVAQLLKCGSSCGTTFSSEVWIGRWGRQMQRNFGTFVRLMHVTGPPLMSHGIARFGSAAPFAEVRPSLAA